jgi:hypothetical protein
LDLNQVKFRRYGLAGQAQHGIDLAGRHAGGQDVLAAGEMMFASAETGWCVTEATNQSTGYCPEPDCWPAVARALDRIGVPHPGGFTDRVIFRRCPGCSEGNIVREDHLTCAVCGSALPARWNLTSN